MRRRRRSKRRRKRRVEGDEEEEEEQEKEEEEGGPDVTARPPAPSEVRRHGVVEDAAGAADPHLLGAAVAARTRLGVLVPAARLLLDVRPDEAARTLLSPLRAPRVLDLPVLDRPADGLLLDAPGEEDHRVVHDEVPVARVLR